MGAGSGLGTRDGKRGLLRLGEKRGMGGSWDEGGHEVKRMEKAGMRFRSDRQRDLCLAHRSGVHVPRKKRHMFEDIISCVIPANDLSSLIVTMTAPADHSQISY
jgi:hypothetical protein